MSVKIESEHTKPFDVSTVEIEGERNIPHFQAHRVEAKEGF